MDGRVETPSILLSVPAFQAPSFWDKYFLDQNVSWLNIEWAKATVLIQMLIAFCGVYTAAHRMPDAEQKINISPEPRMRVPFEARGRRGIKRAQALRLEQAAGKRTQRWNAVTVRYKMHRNGKLAKEEATSYID